MNSLRSLLFLFIVLGLAACKKDNPREIYDLAFPSDVYYVAEGGELSLYINQGNRQYEVEVEDETIIATRADETSWPAGAIFVSGLEKGSTQLSVTDRVTGQKVDLTVHVVDPFLVLHLSSLVPAIKVPAEMPEATRKVIRDEALTYGTLALDQVLILHHTAEQEFLLFNNPADLHKGEVRNRGHYRLLPGEEGNYQLMMEYEDSENVLSFTLSASSMDADDILAPFTGQRAAPVKLASATGRAAGLSTGAPNVHAESPITPPSFVLVTDLTSEFKPQYPGIDFVWLTQQALWWHNFQNYGKIGDGVLK